MAAIVAALAVDLGTYDLSATDQVQEGTFVQPPGSVAFAAVLPAQQIGAENQARNTLVLDTYLVRVRLWAPVTATTTGDRVSRGRLLAEEARTAIERARDTLGNALWKCVAFAVTDSVPHPSPATAAGPGWARAELTITLTFRRASGSGA